MPPNHGSFVPNHCSYKYQKSGETCTAICEASWNVSGPSEIKCYNGSWSSIVPSCIGGSEFAGKVRFVEPCHLSFILNRNCLFSYKSKTLTRFLLANKIT